MKNLGITLALTALLTTGLLAQEPAAPEVVKFSVKAPTAGDVVNRASDQKMDMQIDMDIPEMGPQQMSQKMTSADTRKCTILEAKDGAVTKFKVEYQKVEGNMIMEAAMLPEPMNQDLLEGMNPAGQTWTFTNGADGLSIVNDEGEDADAATREFLTALEWPNEKLGAWAPMFSELTEKREIAVGETILVPKEKALSFVPSQSKDQLGDDAKVTMELTLRSVTTSLGARVANFDSKLRIAASPNADGMDLTMTIEVDGKMQVGIDNMWVYASEMKGPLIAQGGSAEMGMEMNISGNLAMKSLSVYSKVAKEEAK